ncbi:MAG: DUF2232 domain-containing protein [Clostridiales bacterium]|nr:DUF2232 domain-containing protein [Clostridiales bacterium]
MSEDNQYASGPAPGPRRAVCLAAAVAVSVLLGPLFSIFLRGIYSFIAGGIAGGAAAYFAVALFRRGRISLPLCSAIIVLCGAASFILGFLFTSSARDAIADAVYVLPALAMLTAPGVRLPADARASATRRTSVIIRAAVAVAAGFIIYMAAVIAVDGGGFSLGVYRDWLSAENERMRDIMSSLTISGGGEMSALYENERLDRVSAYLIMMLPGVMAVCFFISSWLSTLSYSLLYRADGSYGTEFPDGWKVEISTVSCVVYIAAYLGAGFIGGVGAVYTVCGNLALMLTPAMTLLGVSGIIERFADEDRRGSAIIMTIISLGSLLLSPIFFVTLMSFTGVYYTLSPRIRKKLGRQ